MGRKGQGGNVDTPVRIMWSFTLGNPWRLTPKEERDRLLELMRQDEIKWKAAGVKLLGTFTAGGEGGNGYGHTWLLEAPNWDVAVGVNTDIALGQWVKHIEKYAIWFGWTLGVEDAWAKL